ncbi:D-alanine--D-alanine ligase family protein [Changpingibacter yushuensis]|uniref:D-alanine--D-alanine ligase family protein n=1 Tax=Changpingibacter yushuensis TaxID=2758440 RepID=UPI0015F38430|nr:D-alanine--D-alanine ligase [Changpingibacter yushuensis]
MTKPLTVAILAGGLTHEREVSLHSGRRMATVLREAGMQVKLLDVDAGLIQTLDAMAPDVVWPLLHGSTGEDGSLQDLLTLTGIPYVGSTPAACRMASDKAVACAILAREGLAVPESMTLPQTLLREVGVAPVLDLIKNKFGFPLVVKPAQGGSALGVTIVESGAALPGAMVDCYAYGDEARIEQYIVGREIAVSVLNLDGTPCALPPVEIVTDGPYDYDARYNAGRSEYFVPARLDAQTLDAVKQAAEKVHAVLGLGQISRTDIILEEDGTIRVLDVNVAPGTTETSLFPQAVASYAQDEEIVPGQVYARIIEATVGAAGSETTTA